MYLWALARTGKDNIQSTWAEDGPSEGDPNDELLMYIQSTWAVVRLAEDGRAETGQASSQRCSGKHHIQSTLSRRVNAVTN